MYLACIVVERTKSKKLCYQASIIVLISLSTSNGRILHTYGYLYLPVKLFEL